MAKINESNPNNGASSPSVNKYWAAKPEDEIASEMMTRVEDYYAFLQTSGRMNLWKRSYEFYHRSAIKGGKQQKAGQTGEYTTININHYRNLLKHLQTMTTSQRPAFEARASNTDVKSMEQTILANSLLDYYMRDMKVERYIKTAVEHSLVFAEGFVQVEWDANTGKEYGVNPETGAVIYDGDLKYTNFTPLDVIRDFLMDNADQHNWYITRGWQNRYDLAAEYPELADRILDVPDKLEGQYDNRIAGYQYQESDQIPVYTLMHKPTPALPQGRLTVILDTDIVLLDGPLPYRELPLYRIAPGEQLGTTFGYTVGYDLLPVQETLDNLYSVVVTNQQTFGVQNILVPQGNNLSVSSVYGGLNLIEYDAKLGKPEALNLTQTPAEIFNFMTMLERLGETISGVNSVARGNPEASLKSGSALALVQSQAIQFSQDLQQSYAQLLEDVGTATINILRDYAKVPRIAAITGKANRSYMKNFTGDDLSQVNRVMVDMANPLTRTTAGKVNLAETLLQNQLVDTADQYIAVLQTGRLEPILEGKQAQILLVREENEKLSAGGKAFAMITDNHAMHIMEHAVVLASTESRQDPNIVAATTEHIQEHIAMLQNPALAPLLQLLHQTPMAPVAAPVGSGDPAASAGQQLNAQNPVTQEAAKVNMPNQPSPPAGTDPQTEQAMANAKPPKPGM